MMVVHSSSAAVLALMQERNCLLGSSQMPPLEVSTLPGMGAWFRENPVLCDGDLIELSGPGCA